MKALAIIVPILILGAAVGAGFMGYLPLFGQSDDPVTVERLPSPAPAEQSDTKQTDLGAPVLVGPTPVPQQDEVVEVEPRLEDLDADQGARVLAKIWNEIDARELAGMIVVWQGEDLALILAHMEKRTVADVLSLLGPERAVQLSEQIKALASVVPEEETD